ncbi:putative transcription factor bHLH041 isoform X2 [Musa acuminata AAA Group]|uniref:putative transcription factor bHLH041 isoform X2 n=1 Tax=Musa acuminata AAA Group TaxID=214697 RepID=UPI0031DA0FCA
MRMSAMDSFFLLGAEARGRFLQIAGRTLGCTYICTWTPLSHPPINLLISTDGWHREEDGDLPSSSSGSISLRLFKAYHGSLCSIQNGCIPGLAYKGAPAYIELRDADLMTLAWMNVQREFYQEAGIKTAVFVGCRNGEIELGMTMSPDVIYLTAITCVTNIIIHFVVYSFSSSSSSSSGFRLQTNLHVIIQQVFGEDFVQRYQLGGGGGRDFMRHSQSGNLILPPELGAPFVPEAITEQPLAPSHQMPMQAYNPNRNVQFPAATGDDEAMRRAMLAVNWLPSSSSSPLSHQLDRQQHQIYQGRIDHQIGAFKAYDPALAPKPEANQNLPGQRMIKMGINILTEINRMRMEARAQEHRPTSNQLHHIISERRRRKKINDYFHALRVLLPPGSKKDNVSVLANTKTYLNSLKARLSELEERNQMLERQLKSADDADEVSDRSERVEVQISRSSEFKSEAQQINLSLIVREECDMIDLVLHALRLLKEMRDVILISMDASTRSPSRNIFARANLKLQVKDSDWDEGRFEEAVTKAVVDALAQGKTKTPSHSSPAHQS